MSTGSKGYAYALVCVEWEDAVQLHGDHQVEDVITEHEACMRRSVGWLIHADLEVVIVAMDDDSLNEDGAVGQVAKIPRGMIHRVTCFEPNSDLEI